MLCMVSHPYFSNNCEGSLIERKGEFRESFMQNRVRATAAARTRLSVFLAVQLELGNITNDEHFSRSIYISREKLVDMLANLMERKDDFECFHANNES